MKRHESPSRKLRRFIQEAGVTASGAAAAIGVTGAAVSGYLNRKQVPGDLVRQAIERWTGGKIKRAEWVTDEERARLDKVVPFVAVPDRAAS